MKLYTLTNLKTGLVVRRNATQADIDALSKWIPDKARPDMNGLSFYSVQAFEVGDRAGQTFTPPPIMGVRKKETKGPAAAGHTIDGSESK